MTLRGVICPGLLAMLGTFSVHFAHAADRSAESDGIEFFAGRIQPILEQRCFECHSHGAKKLKAGLFLDSRSGALQGGDSGPALVPGRPDESLLFKAVGYEDVDLQMPPKSRLSDAEISLLEEWIRRGAPWTGSKVQASSSENSPQTFDLAARRASHWAWQPVKPVAPPAVKNATWPAQPIDNFILAKLDVHNLLPAPGADRRTLARRLAFVLTGLPPGPEEVRALEMDPAPEAYEKFARRLLDSPRFGERWARHWLDVVRYSETLGHEFDYPLPNAWRYRDYVIRALNADVPYDQFVREHIAGDLLPTPRIIPETGLNESALATAYHWFGQQVHSPVDIKGNQLDVIDNQIDTLTRGFQALTVSCARCHDHKFDAISTRDFYALYGVLASTRYTQANVFSSPDAVRKLQKLHDLRDRFVRAMQTSTETGLGPKFDGWRSEGIVFNDSDVHVGDLLYTSPTNPVVRAVVPLVSSRKLSTRLQGAIRSPSFVITNRYLHVRAAGRDSRVKLILENFQMIQNPIYGDLKKVLDRSELGWTTFDLGMWTNRIAYLEVVDSSAPDLAGSAGGGVGDNGWFDLAEMIALDEAAPPERPAGFEVVEVAETARATLTEIADLETQLPAPVLAPLVTDSEGIDQPVLIRGGPGKPGEPVSRRYLEALGGLDHPIEHGSGRRRVAELVASPDNPLTARVWVNRVWHHLFGRGLVATVDDFGVLGQEPSHPELLDWLAHWFVTEGEWSTKKLISMLVTSSTWKQSALAADDPVAGTRSGFSTPSDFDQRDPENVWLHKWTVRRLEGEAIRDTILAVSGQLDLEPPPGSVATHLTPFMTGRGRPGASGPLDGDGKRSIYLEVRRNFMSPMMLAFDTPQAAQAFGRRARSNVPAQALILMNDPFVQQQARRLAGRMIEEVRDTRSERRVNWLYEQALQRQPSPDELKAALEFLRSEGPGASPAGNRSRSPADAAGNSEQRTIEEQAHAIPEADASSLDAWADLSHVLFNMKEFVFVN